MSDEAIDAAVAKITGDPEYARKVLENPKETLTAEFDLAEGEWRSLHWVLVEDVHDAMDEEVTGFGLPAGQVDFGNVTFERMKLIPSIKGGFDPGAEWASSWFCRSFEAEQAGEM
jgi:hypothetical protein